MGLLSRIRGRSKHSGTQADTLVLYDGKGYIYELSPVSVNQAYYFVSAIYPVPEAQESTNER